MRPPFVIHAKLGSTREGFLRLGRAIRPEKYASTSARSHGPGVHKFTADIIGRKYYVLRFKKGHGR